MKIVNSSYEILTQGEDLVGIYKHIELAGRTCYKSEEHITKNSATNFVEGLIKLKHFSVLEHGTIYMIIPFSIVDLTENESKPIISECVTKYQSNPYTKVNLVWQGSEGLAHITTNYRVLLENKWLDDLKYLCVPTKYHSKRTTVRFICGRDISLELIRHRKFSFSQESTRYCNYSRDKFDNELAFIQPSWYKPVEFDSVRPPENDDKLMSVYTFIKGLESVEEVYMELLKRGWTPQQARAILPNALKTEVVMTGFNSDWDEFFKKRTSIFAETGVPHPDMSYLCDPLYNEFVKNNYTV